MRNRTFTDFYLCILFDSNFYNYASALLIKKIPQENLKIENGVMSAKLIWLPWEASK